MRQVARFCFLILIVLGGRAGDAAAQLVPSQRLEDAVPGLVQQLGRGRGIDAVAPITALGDIAAAMQPSSFAAPPDTDDPTAQASWRKWQSAMQDRRQRLAALLRPAVEPLIQLTTHADADVRRQALWALGHFRADAAAAGAAVQSIATDRAQPASLRESALLALARIDPAAALPVVERAVGDGDAEARIVSTSVHALREIGAPAVPLLTRLLGHADPLRRGAALDALRSLKQIASPAVDTIGAMIVSDSAPRIRFAALRALVVIAPARTAPLERVLETQSLSRQLCHTAGEALSRRPGALAFDSRRCERHAADSVGMQLSDGIRHALVMAAGGPADSAVTSTGAGRRRGEAEEATERIVVACVEPKDGHDGIRTAARGGDPTAVAPRALRLAAVRVAGDDVVLDSTGGPVDTGAPTAACSDVQVDPITDATRWPLARLKFATASPQANAVTLFEWSGLIDPATRLWRGRVPATTAHVRRDRTHFTDQLRTWMMPDRTVRVSARFAGIDLPVATETPHLAVRHRGDSLALTDFLIDGQTIIVAPSALASAPWLGVVMYPVDWGGAGTRVQPPKGVQILTLSGLLVVQGEPAGAAARTAFWRKQLRHDHLAVRMHAAALLAKEQDRAALPDVVALLTVPSDAALDLTRIVGAYGAEALPFIAPILKDERPHVRSAAWSAVGAIGAAGLPRVRDALESGTPQDAALALKALQQMKPPQGGAVAAQLVRTLERCEDPGWAGDCWDILDALGAAGPSAAEAQPALEAMVRRQKGYRRLRAARALFDVGGRDAGLAAIVELARTAKGSDADSALRTLAAVAREEAPAILAEVFARRDDPQASAAAARQLVELGPAAAAVAFPEAGTMARDADPATRQRALTILRAVRSPEALHLLGVLLRDRDLRVGRDAFDALRDRGVDGVTLLAPILASPDDSRRNDLVAHLGRLGRPAAQAEPKIVDLLEKLAKDPDPLLRSNAGRALASVAR